MPTSQWPMSRGDGFEKAIGEGLPLCRQSFSSGQEQGQTVHFGRCTIKLTSAWHPKPSKSTGYEMLIEKTMCSNCHEHSGSLVQQLKFVCATHPVSQGYASFAPLSLDHLGKTSATGSRFPSHLLRSHPCQCRRNSILPVAQRSIHTVLR